MKVFAFRHASFEELGTLRPALESRGIAVESVELYEPGAQPPPIREAAGLVFMGGPMCANDDLPYLHQEVELIRDAVNIGLPVLGICLGAQLIAKALGAKVYKSPMPEIGWFRIDLTAAGRLDPVFGEAGDAPTVFHWHEDMFEIPPGAELLATGEGCPNQAFRYGRKVYGFQFHPEMTPAMIEDWQRQPNVCGEPVAAIDPELHAKPLAQLCHRIVEAWTGVF